MTSKKDMNSQRQGNMANATHGYSNTKPPTSASYVPTGPSQRFGPYGHPNVAHNPGDASMAALTSAMGGMGMQQSYGHAPKSTSQNGGSSEYGGIHVGQPQTLYVPSQQHLMFTGNHLLAGHNSAQGGMPHTPGMYQPMAHFMPAGNYGYHHGMVDNSPMGQNWTPRLHGSDMPTLITPSPRESLSSNDVDLPGTPYTGYGSYNGVTAIDRTPSNGYAHSGTPSPLGQTFTIPQVPKSMPSPSAIPVAILLLLQQDPPIPRAIPAPSSPLKPLDRSLENKNGETNVYIRGLLPETTDEMLHAWGARFGDIQSSKSIIDMKTNLCKGFGFIKYYNYDDAGQCIRGFHYLGYEVSFARESFYSKLKKFADEHNTNLYVSNIPKNLNEHELSAIFAPFKVCSSRILRDPSGNGRGVGFSRFESRDVCEDVIRQFNNTPVSKPGGEEHLIQIRYSDTQEQKLLKQHTAAARQFRAAEFEYGVLQARNGGMLAPPHERPLSITASEYDAANEFERFMANNVGPSTHSANIPSSVRSIPSSTPAAPSSTHAGSIMTPSIHSPLKSSYEDHGSDSDGDKHSKTARGTPVIGRRETSTPSTNTPSEHE